MPAKDIFHDVVRSVLEKEGWTITDDPLRITVYDVLGWLAAGMSHGEILEDFPELTEEDIRACLEFAAAQQLGW
jgi:uncharacterized protein (DUF433 family)